jgi:hypothetical protein
VVGVAKYVGVERGGRVGSSAESRPAGTSGDGVSAKVEAALA